MAADLLCRLIRYFLILNSSGTTQGSRLGGSAAGFGCAGFAGSDLACSGFGRSGFACPDFDGAGEAGAGFSGVGLDPDRGARAGVAAFSSAERWPRG